MMNKIYNEELIIELYKSGKSLKDIGNQIKSAAVKVKEILIKNNIELRNRFRNVNKEFFKSINTKEKAYLLGLICSDGSIDNTGYAFSFVSKDLDLIQLFKEKIESEHKICKIESYDKRTNKIYTSYTIHICSKELVKQLNDIGITNNKSFTCDLPNISKELFWHFLRGLFDGDGSISKEKIKKEGQLRFSIIGSGLMINKIKDILLKFGLSDTKISNTKYKNEFGSICKIIYYSYKDIKFIYDNMYYDSDNLRLERKYEKFSTLREYKMGNSNYHKQKVREVVQMDLNNNIISIYKNLYEVSDRLNIKKKFIYRVIRGERRQTRGFIFKYLEK